MFDDGSLKPHGHMRARIDHQSATRCRNGKVIIVGGESAANRTARTEATTPAHHFCSTGNALLSIGAGRHSCPRSVMLTAGKQHTSQCEQFDFGAPQSPLTTWCIRGKSHATLLRVKGTDRRWQQQRVRTQTAEGRLCANRHLNATDPEEPRENFTATPFLATQSRSRANGATIS